MVSFTQAVRLKEPLTETETDTKNISPDETDTHKDGYGSRDIDGDGEDDTNSDGIVYSD